MKRIRHEALTAIACERWADEQISALMAEDDAQRKVYAETNSGPRRGAEPGWSAPYQDRLGRWRRKRIWEGLNQL